MTSLAHRIVVSRPRLSWLWRWEVGQKSESPNLDSFLMMSVLSTHCWDITWDISTCQHTHSGASVHLPLKMFFFFLSVAPTRPRALYRCLEDVDSDWMRPRWWRQRRRALRFARCSKAIFRTGQRQGDSSIHLMHKDPPLPTGWQTGIAPPHTQMLRERCTLPEAITEQRKEKPRGDKGVKTSGQPGEDSLYNSCLEETRSVRLALLCVTIGGGSLVQKADSLCVSFWLMLLGRCH